MSPDPMTYNAALVLQAMIDGHSYGFEIMEVTELPSGTVYPILRRLEGRGLVSSRWEDADRARAEGRPRRRYYEPTGAGRAALAEAVERIRAKNAIFEGLLADDDRRPGFQVD